MILTVQKIDPADYQLTPTDISRAICEVLVIIYTVYTLVEEAVALHRWGLPSLNYGYFVLVP